MCVLACELFESCAPLTLASVLDRTNLGNARLMGLPDVLGGDPTGVLFDWANSAFFITFVCQSAWLETREFTRTR